MVQPRFAGRKNKTQQPKGCHFLVSSVVVHAVQRFVANKYCIVIDMQAQQSQHVVFVVIAVLHLEVITVIESATQLK